jgi:very-short-patch-repair endonuclease
MLRYNPRLKPKARALRTNLTDAEQRLWSRLRRKQISGVQFYRQRPVGNYIVDFFAPAVRLVIEVDGAQHAERSEAEYDKERSEYLEQVGLRVLRFDDRQVLTETDGVIENIFQIVTHFETR